MKYPFYGYRRIQVSLAERGLFINHKKVQRLMKYAGIQAIYSEPKTTIKNQAHKRYKYLLRDMIVERPNQVWEIDITYIKIRHGFVYLVCLIDVFSRKIMGHCLSTFLDTQSCLQALYNGILHATPEIINSDQGCQFTSNDWISTLTALGIQISMDGKGRCLDNIYIEHLWKTIKYEAVYLHNFDSVEQVRKGIDEYIVL